MGLFKDFKTSFAELYAVLKRRPAAVLLATVNTLLSFYSDIHFFEAPIQDHIVEVIILKLLFFIAMLIIWNEIISLIKGENEKLKQIILYGLPYFILISIIARNAGSIGELVIGDEFEIYKSVINYDLQPAHFTYFIGLIYGLSYLLFPFEDGVVIVKVIFQALCCGYVIYRFHKEAGRKAYLMNIIFLLEPMLEFSCRTHRMQFYAPLYLVLAVKLLMDHREGKAISKSTFILYALTFSFLAFFRKEGLYLVVMTPLLICLAYGLHSKPQIIKTTLSCLLISALVYLPQLLTAPKFTEESSHTYNHWFINMSREGLDWDKYPEQIEKIDKYLSLDTVKRINEDLGDLNYADEYIAWYEGYMGIRADCSEEDYEQYCNSVMYITIHEPLIFMLTRIKTWFVTATGTYDFSSPAKFISSCFKSLMWSLNIPMLAVIISCIYGLIKRKWLLFWISAMAIVHAAITVVFSPAAYFKYYLQLYLLGWCFIISFIIYCIHKAGLKRDLKAADAKAVLQ